MSSYYTNPNPNPNANTSNDGFYNQWQPQPQPQSHQSQSYSSDFDGSSQTQQQHHQQQQHQWSQQQPQTSMMYGHASQPAAAAAQPHQQPAFWNPATTAMAAAALSKGGGNMNASTANALVDMASPAVMNFLENHWSRMIPGLETTMRSLRRYFAVDNRYVLVKMKKVAFPYLSKSWKRQPASGEGSATGSDHAPGDLYSTNTIYELPIRDENAPDLYLPTMSLITYVLLCALVYGNAGKFEPEVIPDVTTKCFLTQILEVLLIRLGFYMMQAPVAILDLFAYTGYKYLGLCVNMLVALAVGHFRKLGVTGYYVTFLWTASALSFFMLKTMANNIPTITSSTGPKREVMVLAFAASQCATMWFVSQTKFL